MMFMSTTVARRLKTPSFYTEECLDSKEQKLNSVTSYSTLPLRLENNWSNENFISSCYFVYSFYESRTDASAVEMVGHRQFTASGLKEIWRHCLNNAAVTTCELVEALYVNEVNLNCKGEDPKLRKVVTVLIT
ncbi:hypothetical protein M514_10872 [Trichuris suis]|uniref:Uncharacterized protein n=1 Tax=Trichuris suis TaxID=68888 RepID=A0A085NK09_9BILA|nr:hypothetical protein M513_10872 [Trichuris suis]KFD69805.1 hypothetical protein M514_10872 [Trichuris suis]